MKLRISPILNVSVLMALGKGFSIFYFVLLPVFYAEKIISAEQIGIIGAIFIVLVIVGALVVARWLHNLETKKLIQLSAIVAIFSSCILLTGALQKNIIFIIISYTIMGLAEGTVMSALNGLAGQITTRGERFSSFALIGTSMDIVRIVFPLLVSGAVVLGNSSLAITLIIIACVLLFILSSKLQSGQTSEKEQITKPTETIRRNKNFLYVLSIEFFDSFSSSQLFVFLPLLFLTKGYSLESSLLLQSFVFLGYIVGRWFVSFLAKRYSGMKAVGLAEIGMVITIIFLITVHNILLLYFFTFILGVFVRGTSPAIKAVAYDTLDEQQLKRGSAVHVVAGDSGSALGQLIFGYFVAWFGASSPFIAAAIVAAFIGIVIFIKPIRIHKIESVKI